MASKVYFSREITPEKVLELYEKLENKEAFDQYLGQMYQIYLQHYQELNK